MILQHVTRWTVFAAALVTFAGAALSPSDTLAATPLHGEIIHIVHNPFERNDIGYGLASDGLDLFATSAADGVIRVYDPETLQLRREIATPASSLLGLTYRDGELFALMNQSTPDPFSPARIYVIDAADGTPRRTLDGIANGTVSLAFDAQGQLFGVDGFTGPSGDATVVNQIDPANGATLATYRAREFVVGEDLTVSEFSAADPFEWLSDGTLLFDNPAWPPQRPDLSSISLSNGQIVNNGAFIVPGLPKIIWHGTALIEDRLFMWGLLGTDRTLCEVQVVPEPNSMVLCVSAGCLALFCRRDTFPRRRLRVERTGDTDCE